MGISSGQLCSHTDEPSPTSRFPGRTNSIKGTRFPKGKTYPALNQPSQQTPKSLRGLVFQGGLYLGVRQAIGLAIGLLGPIYLLREIGPRNYGLYAAALSVLSYVQLVAQWGVEIYLMRHPQSEDCPEVYHQGFTILIVLTLLGIGGSIAVLPLLNSWMKLGGFRPVASLMFLTLPFLTLRQVPLARLERGLDYKRIALIELSGQASFYLVALPLAFRDRNVWAPVTGWWVQQALLFTLFFLIARYRPSLHFSLHLTKRILGYGLGYSASIWVWQLRSLVNPLVVGRYAGGAAVGFVALAIRLVEVLSFAKSAAWRISIAALARLQNDTGRLLRAISEGMRLQVLAVGPPLLTFSLAGPFVLRALFGPRWTPVMLVYPFIALSYMTNSAYTLSSSALFVLCKNWDVAAFHVIHVFMFAGTAFLLVPRLGIAGYGWAEMAGLASYPFLDAATRRKVGRPDYSVAALWWFAFGSAFFDPLVGWIALMSLALLILWPPSFRYLVGYAKEGLRTVRGGVA